MKTHTLRHKSGPTPIATFTAPFFALLLSAEPEAVALTLGWFTQQYRALTGKVLSLDHAQTQALLAHAGANTHGQWTSRFSRLTGVSYRIRVVFEKGFMQNPSGMTLEEALELAQGFYRLLEPELLKVPLDVSNTRATS